MKKQVKIKQVCPMCDKVLITNYQYKNQQCNCLKNSGVFFEPISIIVETETPFQDWIDGKEPIYTLNKPLYFNTINEFCENNCDKCDDCEFNEKEDEFDNCKRMNCIGNHCEFCDTNLRDLKQLEEKNVIGQEVYSLYSQIASFIIPRLEYWIVSGLNGCPVDITLEKWKEILNKILKGMKLISADKIQTAEDEKSTNKACQLLGKWFKYLWD